MGGPQHHTPLPISLISQPAHHCLRNTLAGGVWHSSTPVGPKPLATNLGSTPSLATLLPLPLMSPGLGATPSLGIGSCMLASCSSGRSLDQVVNIPLE